MIMMVYSQGELGQPGLPGPTGPIAVGIQGEKVRATSLSKCYLIAFVLTHMLRNWNAVAPHIKITLESLLLLYREMKDQEALQESEVFQEKVYLGPRFVKKPLRCIFRLFGFTCLL